MRILVSHTQILSLLVLNGPNLNLLGTREPHLYGTDTLADVEGLIRKEAETAGIAVEFLQSNHEGALIDAIHKARTVHHGIIINPGGLTHTSVALRDAFGGVALPFVEVHITNVHQRESFRHHSYLSDMAEAVMVGAGTRGYLFALQTLISRLRPAALAEANA
ncbi:type II 3-dehydroquinate dehydratase [Arthrobacter sp. NPDC089319]|uniref:type II 3-dehydroquinate dehydratase n=1 Tax=Arthrobacter sp. NPDC089319 TaxID=3155915 RepID=UPI0034191FC0